MKRQADAMVSHAVLREIVSADFFFTSAGTDLAAALCAVFFLFLALLSLQQARAQDRERSLLVFDLTATVLTTHDCACRNVQHLHGRVGRVHALPARRGHTLYTMHSAFVAELTKNRFARNPEDRFLKSTELRRTRFEVLGF